MHNSHIALRRPSLAVGLRDGGAEKYLLYHGPNQRAPLVRKPERGLAVERTSTDKLPVTQCRTICH